MTHDLREYQLLLETLGEKSFIRHLKEKSSEELEAAIRQKELEIRGAQRDEINKLRKERDVLRLVKYLERR